MPFVRPLVEASPRPPGSTAEIPGLVDEAFAAALTPAHRARRSSTSRSTTSSWRPRSRRRRRAAPPHARAGRRRERRARASRCCADAERPGDHGRHRTSTGATARSALLRARRGAPASPSSSTASRAAACPPTTSSSSRARARTALKGADVALVIGVPMDFRLGFGASFGEDDRDRRDRRRRARARPPARRSPPSSTARCRRSLARAAPAAAAPTRAAWVATSCARPRPRSARPSGELRDDPRAPLHPMRLYARARRGARPQRDRRSATAATSSPTPGASIDSYEPGCWLDPGPFGCLGSRAGLRAGGQARAARPPGRAAARRRRVRLLGMEFDTLARHGVNVVGVMGNNGIWALEKHPMEFLYGYSVAADLRPETPLRPGRRGARRPRRAGARAGRAASRALERAFAAGKPALVNVLTDPSVAYPRSLEPRLDGRRNEKPPAAGAGGFKLAPSGRAGVRALRGLLGGPDGGRRRLMRHTPGPMRRADGGGRHDRPCRRAGVSPAFDQRRQSNKRPEDTPYRDGVSRVGRAARSAAPQQDVVLGDLDARRARTRAATSSRITTPATIVGARSGSQAGHLAALGERQRGQAVEHAASSARGASTWPSTRSGS